FLLGKGQVQRARAQVRIANGQDFVGDGVPSAGKGVLQGAGARAEEERRAIDQVRAAGAHGGEGKQVQLAVGDNTQARDALKVRGQGLRQNFREDAAFLV